MSTPSDYGDSQDQADYQVVKSNSRRGNSTRGFINLERFLTLSIIFILLLIMFFQYSRIKTLENTNQELKEKIETLESSPEEENTIEGRVKNLEGRVKNLETTVEQLKNESRNENDQVSQTQ